MMLTHVSRATAAHAIYPDWTNLYNSARIAHLRMQILLARVDHNQTRNGVPRLSLGPWTVWSRIQRIHQVHHLCSKTIQSSYCHEHEVSDYKVTEMVKESCWA